jgi:hypothetical protein
VVLLANSLRFVAIFRTPCFLAFATFATSLNPLFDPDNPQLTEADLARLKPPPKPRALRIRLWLTREEFAARCHIPPGTLRGWEQRGASFETAPRGASSG